jgi:hypothetical protein
VSVAEQVNQSPYTGPTLLDAVRVNKFDPALLPKDDSIQQRWIYAAMLQAFRRDIDDAPTLVLINRWDGCTMWPAEYPCPYHDALHRSKPIRDALIARMAAAMPPLLAGRQPRVCYCGGCIPPAASTGDRDVLAPLLPGADQIQLRWDLCVAARENDAPAVKLLLEEAKVAPSATTEGGETALHFAAGRGSMDAARGLLAAGANVNAIQVLHLIQSTPLDKAKVAGKKEMEQLLRDAGGLTITELRAKQAAGEAKQDEPAN